MKNKLHYYLDWYIRINIVLVLLFLFIMIIRFILFSIYEYSFEIIEFFIRLEKYPLDYESSPWKWLPCVTNYFKTLQNDWFPLLFCPVIFIIRRGLKRNYNNELIGYFHYYNIFLASICLINNFFIFMPCTDIVDWFAFFLFEFFSEYIDPWICDYYYTTFLWFYNRNFIPIMFMPVYISTFTWKHLLFIMLIGSSVFYLYIFLPI